MGWNDRRDQVCAIRLEENFATFGFEDLVRDFWHPEVALDHEFGVTEPLACLIEAAVAHML